jgi:hypothetical protein
MATNVLGKYSMGIGDRFGLQAKAQLAAIRKAARMGTQITPVWNKSFREHTIVRSLPSEARSAADAAVRELGWKGSYFVDADHVNAATVESFIDCSDYFTLDLADFVGKSPTEHETEAFLRANEKYVGTLDLKDSEKTLEITRDALVRTAKLYLYAAREAGKLYGYIKGRTRGRDIVIEVSMDETEAPQSPPELFFILGALAQEGVPLQAIAPKFVGRFNKGVDYAGDVELFRRDFELHLRVIRYAVQEWNLPRDLKLSVHTGSDKFSLYPVMNSAIKRYNSGIHLKTAGTTWLEELIGLAESEGEGLRIAKEIYARSLEQKEALCAPYTAIIDIRDDRLPTTAAVRGWDGRQFAEALRHEPANPRYSPDLRQLLHIGFKIAADMRTELLDAIRRNEEKISGNVTFNLLSRHIGPLFLE